MPPGFTEGVGWPRSARLAPGSNGPGAGGDLIPGWNLVSISVQPADTAPAAVLASIAGSYRVAYAYDGLRCSRPLEALRSDRARAQRSGGD